MSLSPIRLVGNRIFDHARRDIGRLRKRRRRPELDGHPHNYVLQSGAAQAWIGSSRKDALATLAGVARMAQVRLVPTHTLIFQPPAAAPTPRRSPLATLPPSLHHSRRSHRSAHRHAPRRGRDHHPAPRQRAPPRPTQQPRRVPGRPRTALAHRAAPAPVPPPELTTMTIEIHRCRMTIPVRKDGRVAVGYNIRVPIDDCPPNSSNHYIHTDDGEYQDYPDATWSTDLPPCWTRYKTWLHHERQARRQMLRFLHEHCPETRELTEWPVVWAYVDPDLAQDLHTVHFTHRDPAATEHPIQASMRPSPPLRHNPTG